MNYAVKILTPADADTVEAALWYDAQLPGLVAEFMTEVNAAAQRLTGFAEIHRIRFADVRRAHGWDSVGLRRGCLVLTIDNQFAQLCEWSSRLDSSLATPSKDRAEVTSEDGASAFEVLFRIGSGGGNVLERLIEDGDDSVLFGKRRERQLDFQ